MTEPPEMKPTIVLPDNPVTAALTPILVSLGVLVAGMATVLTFVKTRDVLGLITWLQTQPGLGFIAAVATIALPAWRAIHGVKRAARNGEVADRVPNNSVVRQSEVSSNGGIVPPNINLVVAPMGFLLFGLMASCAETTGPPASVPVEKITRTVSVQTLNALSRAELAFNSAEDAATVVVKSGHLSPAAVDKINDAILAGRGYRDKARSLVNQGIAAVDEIGRLNQLTGAIQALTGINVGATP